MEERLNFLMQAAAGQESISALCREFGVSRQSAYRLLKRAKSEGLKAALPRSRRPLTSPQALSAEQVLEIVSIRVAHPRWGAKKIRAILEGVNPGQNVPAQRTINRVLERTGLVEKRRRRGGRRYYPEKVIRPVVANEVWTIDVKGWWCTKDGKRCYPLTIRDEHSKFILDIAALSEVTAEAVKRRLLLCFKRYGLPRYIRSDNGAPFCAATAVQGLSTLAVWWIELGILPNRIPKASPQYNGGHERMHRDMKAELQLTPARDIKLQQRIFDAWRHQYNYERPHEALKMKRPGDCYSPSSTTLPNREAAYRYGEPVQVRRVGLRGEIWWRGKRFFLSNALHRKNIGIKEEENQLYSLWFKNFFLGKTDFRFKSSPVRGKTVEETKRCKVSPMSWH